VIVSQSVAQSLDTEGRVGTGSTIPAKLGRAMSQCDRPGSFSQFLNCKCYELQKSILVFITRLQIVIWNNVLLYITLLTVAWSSLI